MADGLSTEMNAQTRAWFPYPASARLHILSALESVSALINVKDAEDIDSVEGRRVWSRLTVSPNRGKKRRFRRGQGRWVQGQERGARPKEETRPTKSQPGRPTLSLIGGA